ncbi:ATP-binding protein, partial [Peptococcaceae bacterium]|nr:ATP-binding protein [Peptococcaceae bacterium]
MKIPYGISNFKIMREENYIYIDKTKAIETLEKTGSKYILFIRPRRFGKSLFISTLQHYYDVNEEQNYNNLFKDLYTGKNPTSLKNSYLVMRFNFSGLNTDNKESLERSFTSSIMTELMSFLKKYRKQLQTTDKTLDQLEKAEDIRAMLELIFNKIKETDKKLYIIIDEYDHFANDIIAMGDNEFYKDIIRATGFVRDFYETIKIGTESVIDRIFITGISPVMMDDLTSGFNIAQNLTLKIELNEMMGFTEQEVKCMLERLDIKLKSPENQRELSIDEILEILKKNYNGYLFNEEAKERIYNPSMLLCFLNEAVHSRFPRTLIDDNIKTDYGRLNRLAFHPKNKQVLDQIIKDEEITAKLETAFSFDRMYDEQYFVSLLFYMGLLTIDKKQYGLTNLKIPNYVVKELFWEYIENRIKIDYGVEPDIPKVAKAIWEMGTEGKIKPFLDYISENVIKPLSNRNLIKFDEKYIKIIMLAYLTLTKQFHIISERETQEGYIDIYLEKDLRAPDIKYEWAIELKYLKESERGKLDEVIQRGREQLKKYIQQRGLKDKEN